MEHRNEKLVSDPLISIVLVNWNTKGDLIECLTSVFSSAYRNFHVILVDNASIDGSVEAVEKLFPSVTTLTNHENLGYTKGNNIGLRKAIEIGSPYTLFLNTDTVIDKRLLGEFVRTMEKEPCVGILGPKIYFSDNPDIIQYAGGRFKPITGRVQAIGILEKDQGQYDVPREVDFISGCAMFFRTNLVDEIGFFDEDYYHGFEDVDLSVRCRKKGYTIKYSPVGRVWHKLAASSGGYDSPSYVYYQMRNRLLFVKKNGSVVAKLLFPFPFMLHLTRRILELVRKGKIESLYAVYLGIRDFFLGRFGKGMEFKHSQSEA